MKSATKRGAAALLSFALAGCAAPPAKELSYAELVKTRTVHVTKADIAGADYGEKPAREEAMRKITSFLEQNLIDPDSMKLQCDDSAKGWLRKTDFDKPQFGWVVSCEVNAKNRLGGYTGAQEHFFLFNGSFFGHWKFYDRMAFERASGYAN